MTRGQFVFGQLVMSLACFPLYNKTPLEGVYQTQKEKASVSGHVGKLLITLSVLVVVFYVLESAVPARDQPKTMRSVMFFVGAAACLFLNGRALAQKLILMENFDPAQAEGIWYTVERTGTLYNDSVSCTKYEVKHKDGLIYEVELSYKDKSNTLVNNVFRVMEDSDHPAQFFFADKDNKKVAVSFLGTDYKNWNVGFGYVHGNVPVYGIGSRTPVLDPKYLEEAKAVLKKNEVGNTEKCQPL